MLDLYVSAYRIFLFISFFIISGCVSDINLSQCDLISENFFGCIAPPPSPLSITPSSGPIAGGTTITISGSGLSAESIITIGGTTGSICGNVTFVNTNQISCTTSTSITAGIMDVIITNSDGQIGILPSGYTYEPNVAYMWITSSSSQGDIGGINGADTMCEMEGPGLTFTTTVSNHKAVISSSSYDARNIINGNTPIRRRDGTSIAPRYMDYFNNALPLTNTVTTTANFYWSGISQTGLPSTSNCNNWTVTTGQGLGLIGASNALDSVRLSLSSTNNCNYASGVILCISF